MSQDHLRSILLVLCLRIGYAANITSRTYIDVDPNSGYRVCVRQTNGQKQVGCGSPKGGADGVLHIVNSTLDLDWVLKDGPHHPYIPIVAQTFFNRANLTTFNNNPRISGVLLLMENSSSTYSGSFSTETQCPNDGFGIYGTGSNCSWNLAGDSLFHEDFKIPIFSLFPNDDAASIIKHVLQYNSLQNGAANDYPLCAANMNSFMYAVKDTFTCMTQSQYGSLLGGSVRCDALSGENVWGTLTGRDLSMPYDEREIIMVVTRLDSNGFFQDLSPGAESAASGLIALLSTIQALSNTLDAASTWANKIVFAVFNGESFDYIGSSRMVWDMARGFPGNNKTGTLSHASISLSNIRTIIEIGQVGLSNTPNNLFLHFDEKSSSTDELRNMLTEYGRTSSIQFTNGSGILPPASSQSFLREDRNISVVVLADYGEHYTNRFYNSYLDDAQNLGTSSDSDSNTTVNQLTSLATAVAKTLAGLAGAPPSEISLISANASYVADVAECFTVNFSCPLVNNSFSVTLARTTIPVLPSYIGIAKSSANQWISQAVQRVLAQAVATSYGAQNTSANCASPNNDVLNTYFNMSQPLDDGTITSRCVVAPVYTHTAESPAFQDPVDYRSTRYSTWTESQWSATDLKIYLTASPASQHTALGVGLTIFVASILLALQINRVSGSLFACSPPSSPLQNQHSTAST